MNTAAIRKLGRPNSASLTAAAVMYGCSEEQARAGYRKNADSLVKMADECERAAAKGWKEYRGYPATVAMAGEFRAQAEAYRAV